MTNVKVFQKKQKIAKITSHLFPLPCGAGSTIPHAGFESSVIMPFSWCVVAVTVPI